MKSLSLSRPLVLLIIGVPGSGKSFFARQFAETFSAPLVNHDYIRSQIFEDPQYSKAEESIVQDIGLQQVEELLKTQKTFIIDGYLNARTERQAIQKLATERDYGTLTVWVQTDEPTSRQRATRRNPKRQGDIYDTSLTSEQFESQAKRLTPPAPQESFVVISGKHTYATQAKIILKKLVAPREEQDKQQPAQPISHEKQPDQPRRRNVIIN